MTRTPDEIKKGLECCAKVKAGGICPFDCPLQPLCESGDDGAAQREILALIQQLEADNAQQARCIENLTDKLNATNEAIPRWISVEDAEKPKHGKDYLCICSLPNDQKHEWDWMAVLRWHAHGGNGYVNGPHFQHEGSEGMSVTHWMPLPEPPKGN